MAVNRTSTIGGAFRLIVWLLTVVMLMALISVPTSAGVQALLGLTGVGLVLILRSMVQARFTRMLLLGVGSVIVLRYWFWRLFDTLPGLEDPVSFTAAIMLFGIETYLIGVFFLSCFLMADPIDHERPPAVDVRDLPTVDILVPSLNEPADLLAVTLAAARNIAYPEHLLRVVLCDDGGTDARCSHPDPSISTPARNRREQLRILCDELGVVYHTRFDNRMAKAGNLNEAMAELDGELVVIFDADHAPTRDFLARTVGYFNEDDRLALVQTPHFFLNPDPVARNLNLGENSPPEYEMFYNLTHKGLDRWGGAFFCGSAAVLRRSALDAVGGISGKTVTEDAETAIAIHARGWRSMYLNHAMIAGLQPETFASFLQQRGRWCTGMIQLLITKNPFFVGGLNMWQRLSYLSSMSFWLFPFMRIGMLLAPLLYLFFGLELFVTTATEALAYMVSYIAVAFLVQNALFGSVRWPFMSEIYEIAQAPYLVRAVVGAILRPRSARFAVTSKNEVVSERTISEVYRPLLFLFLLMVSGVGVLAWRWMTFPGDREILQIVGVWAVFNLILVGAALRSVVEPMQRRAMPRVKVEIPAVGAIEQMSEKPETVACKVLDISVRGALVAVLPKTGQRGYRSLSRGDRFRFMPTKSFGFEHAAPIECKVSSTRMVEGRLTLGISFDYNQSQAGYRTIAAMMSGDSARWRRIRTEQTTYMGLIRGTLHAVMLFAVGVVVTFAAMLRSSGGPVVKPEPMADTGWDASNPIEAQAFIDSAGTSRAPTPRSRAVARPTSRSQDLEEVYGGEFASFRQGGGNAPRPAKKSRPASAANLF